MVLAFMSVLARRLRGTTAVLFVSLVVGYGAARVPDPQAPATAPALQGSGGINRPDHLGKP